MQACGDETATPFWIPHRNYWVPSEKLRQELEWEGMVDDFKVVRLDCAENRRPPLQLNFVFRGIPNLGHHFWMKRSLEWVFSLFGIFSEPDKDKFGVMLTFRFKSF